MGHLLLTVRSNPDSSTDSVASKAMHLCEKLGIDIVVELENDNLVHVTANHRLPELIHFMRIARGEAEQELAQPNSD